MTLGVIGQKVGMSRIFADDGYSTPVTVVHVEPNRVSQIKTDSQDGYSAIQVTIGSRRPNRVTLPLKGHFAKAETEPGRKCREFRVDAETASQYSPGSAITVDIFQIGQRVDVQGVTIGRGFSGVMRRHGFGGGRATHGNSKAHRKPGSIGQNQDPGRVFKGKKMAGHMGDATRTQQNLEIHSIDTERNLLLIRGAVPGSKGQDILVKPSVKNNLERKK
ncbi:MAG: 50S ribosomal protein L3 [Acidiferrobacteraceae bacterium]|nr:50S ribosomal protein L3 [Acidiferrobacteraceae bacterium]